MSENNKKVIKKSVEMKNNAYLCSEVKPNLTSYEESLIFTLCLDSGHDRSGTIHLRILAAHAANCSE
jgi:hypothetical protein